MYVMSVGAADSIETAIQKALYLSKEGVAFEFHDVTVRVFNDTDVHLLRRAFDRALAGDLGPRPTIGQQCRRGDSA